jgi:hypothetical protein
MRRFHAERLGWTAVGWAVAAAVVVTEAAMVTSLVGRAGEAIEAVSPLTLGVAVGGSVLALVGATVLAMSRHRDLVLLSATASMLMIVAVLALFSVGFLALPLAVVTLVLLGRRTSGRQGLAVPLLAGPAVAVGLAVLFVIWVQPPLVECREHGVSGTSRPWWGSGSGSGSGEVSPSGVSVATGSIETPSGRYVYRCEGRTLIEFRRG